MRTRISYHCIEYYSEDNNDNFSELVTCEGFRPSLCKISENEELSSLVVKVSEKSEELFSEDCHFDNFYIWFKALWWCLVILPLKKFSVCLLLVRRADHKVIQSKFNLHYPAFEHNFSVKFFKRSIVKFPPNLLFSPVLVRGAKRATMHQHGQSRHQKGKWEYFENKKIVEPSLRSFGLRSGYQQSNKVRKFKQIKSMEVQIDYEFLLDFHKCRNEIESVFLSLSQTL